MSATYLKSPTTQMYGSPQMDTTHPDESCERQTHPDHMLSRPQQATYRETDTNSIPTLLLYTDPQPTNAGDRSPVMARSRIGTPINPPDRLA